MQLDLAGVTDFEVYVGDRLVYALAARYDGAIYVDRYTDFDGFSRLQVARILGAVVHETVEVFGDLTFSGEPAQRASWCEIGCGAVGGGAASAAGAAAFAGCLAVIKKPAICKVVGGAVGGAVLVAVKDACEQQFCRD